MLLFGLGSMACDDNQKDDTSPELTPREEITPATTKVCRTYFRVYDKQNGLYSREYFNSYQLAMAYKNRQQAKEYLTIMAETVC
jgi:hypothetical protein